MTLKAERNEKYKMHHDRFGKNHIEFLEIKK